MSPFYDTLMDLAQDLIRKGEPIPVDLSARLLEQGYDLSALEPRDDPYDNDTDHNY